MRGMKTGDKVKKNKANKANKVLDTDDTAGPARVIVEIQANLTKRLIFRRAFQAVKKVKFPDRSMRLILGFE